MAAGENLAAERLQLCLYKVLGVASQTFQQGKHRECALSWLYTESLYVGKSDMSQPNIQQEKAQTWDEALD